MMHDDSVQRKRETKQQMKDRSLKQRYDAEIESQKFKKFSNSSYLTPEAALYLNEVMAADEAKVDDEVVYAGLHDPSKKKKDFKRNEKFSSKYRKARGMKRRKKGRFG